MAPFWPVGYYYAVPRDDRKCVFFDFDGVIVDSFFAAYGTARKVCQYETEERYRSYFEGNINDARLPHDERDHTQCSHDLDWWENYVPLFERAHPFPGIIRALHDLSAHYRMAIISSNISSPVMSFLKKHDAAQYFEDVFGNDVHPSKVEKMHMLFERYELAPEHCLFVTDTLGDIREATAAGVGAIGVSWGFHEHQRLENGNPFKIIDHPHELPGAVEEYFASQAI